MLQRVKRVITRGKKAHPNSHFIAIIAFRLLEIIRERTHNLYLIINRNSTFKRESEMYMCSLFPKEALDIMLDYYHPTSILDVGCGTGVSLDYFKTKKIDVLGIEGSKLAISKANNPNLIIQHNLNKPLALKQTFDVVWCFEVIEHIHPKYENNIIHILINHSDNIVLSAAQPGQGGHGHFNEKPLKYWIDKFENLNFIYLEKLSEDMRRTKDINAKNLLAFSKRR